MAISHYQVFNNWIFDGKLKTPLPKPKIDDDGKEIIPDLLKYNSPINNTYLIKLFLKNGPLNYYLDSYFNNINVRYINKEELLYFIKKSVIQYKIQKRDLMFYSYRQKDKLHDKLKYKFPMLKEDDLNLLCLNILKSKEKQSVLDSLGLEKEEKIKKKRKTKKKEKISFKTLIEENFSMMDI